MLNLPAGGNRLYNVTGCRNYSKTFIPVDSQSREEVVICLMLLRTCLPIRNCLPCNANKLMFFCTTRVAVEITNSATILKNKRFDITKSAN